MHQILRPSPDPDYRVWYMALSVEDDQLYALDLIELLIDEECASNRIIQDP